MMRLIEAPGSIEMQRAIANEHVQTLAKLLLSDEINFSFFRLIASFLRKHEQNTSTTFSEELDALRQNKSQKSDQNGQPILSPHINKILQTLESLYKADKIDVGFRRGAVVELIVYNLVHYRCESKECFNNYCLEYSNKRKSDQIDIIVFAQNKHRIEGYTCKMTSKYIMSIDCTNLTELIKEGNTSNYLTHVGAVSFDYDSKLIRQRIRHLSIPSLPYNQIHAYGLDNLFSLKKDPFIKIYK